MSIRRWRLSQRQQKIWLSLAGTLAGVLAMTWLALSVQRARSTDYADPLASITAFELDDAAEKTTIRFEERAREVGLFLRHGPRERRRSLCEDTGSGLAWGDYDGDGDFDLYVVNFADRHALADGGAQSSRLFRNDAGLFTDVTQEAGVANAQGCGMGASWADFDDDGLLDLYVTNYGGPNRLYRNQGDGRFTEISVAAGVADELWSTGVAWGDFDRDGNLDLYVCNYVDYDLATLPEEAALTRGDATYNVPFRLNPSAFDPVPNRLYHNLGDGTFADVAPRCQVANTDGRSFAASFVDLDGDGWLDLYVCNDVGPNRLYRNVLGDLEGNGDASGTVASYADLSAMTGTADFRGSMGLSVGETGQLTGHGDGLPDIFFTNWIAQENALYQSLRTASGFVEYRDRNRLVRLGEISLDMVGWGCGFADLDLDGDLDLVVANGSTLERPEDPRELEAQPLFVLMNTGTAFREVAREALADAARTHCARGLAIADYDGDGLPDVAVSVNRGQFLLLHNTTHVRHQALSLRLVGPSATRFGARVEVRSGDANVIQWYGADVSYLSMHAPELIFGLGSQAQAERVEVRWSDGALTTLDDVPSGSQIVRHPSFASP